ncbi:GNAT family N-acetyltransferase [Subsaximicrobium wynnwilliamsii]|uniref:GNAT family N-acetyltransferase n=1 Tax=Subsaximicrobium wynnwilliamsii TaxID=291179 RepID=A0A5C6ZLP9_9FLAO|nr:GNAT family N-acetyltransferase [Subsaximicrobium wynnwilliamsii]TXD85171.1 GNAT family N-acetyltransferase [Subsaximicrobium wynnwilliamsii]TXD91214.1 GNAT family N-acetyltransferase [Subsaximicrobium wynnwilliamsii]TXE04608.1 GNAT family N-acetyltransferase [Subsaximicrobium wynnwilliamsii]
MSQESIVIREIREADNAQLEQVIKGCFPEFEIPLKGTAYEDAETPKMFESYQGEKEVYYVVVKGDQVLGGAGIKKLKNYEGNVCELQKMYFSPEVRGRGFGKQLIIQCMEAAAAFGYAQCYLESAVQLKAAIHVYEQAGFKQRTEPLGNTGHYSCGVWMEKEL